MSIWYDLFSLFYDAALEDLYSPYRAEAISALRLEPGYSVVDLPCGTGQSFAGLISAIGPGGRLVAVDQSAGMLARARRRVRRAGWANVTLHRAAAADFAPSEEFDAVLCALGLTALPEWETAFDRIYQMLRPGGRFVIFDVFAAERTRQTRSVELVARADLSRKAWVPLMNRCPDFKREVLPADPEVFGGELYVASGTKANTL